MTRREHKAVADTTREQIGAMTLARLSARNYSFDSDGMDTLFIFQVGSRRGRLEKVVVTYRRARDTYDVRFLSMNTKTYEFVRDETETDMYCDQLAESVERLASSK